MCVWLHKYLFMYVCIQLFVTVKHLQHSSDLHTHTQLTFCVGDDFISVRGKPSCQSPATSSHQTWSTSSYAYKYMVYICKYICIYVYTLQKIPKLLRACAVVGFLARVCSLLTPAAACAACYLLLLLFEFLFGVMHLFSFRMQLKVKCWALTPPHISHCAPTRPQVPSFT